MESKEEFKARLKFNAEPKVKKEMFVKVHSRLDNPYLKFVNLQVKDNGKRYEDYNGVNVSEGEDKGKVLKIRHLQTVGKDGSGTYLFAGYICNTENEFDDKKDDYSGMIPVCFETYKTLEEFVKDDKQVEINAVLEFLSDPENFINTNELKYIGQLDSSTQENESGEVEIRPIIKKLQMSNSPANEKQILKMQEDYKNAKNNM